MCHILVEEIDRQNDKQTGDEDMEKRCNPEGQGNAKNGADETLSSYIHAYREHGDIWESHRESYDTPATVKFLNCLPPCGLVLDEGCGTGLFAETLLCAGHSVHGFDASADAISFCGQRINKLRIDESRHRFWIQDLRNHDLPTLLYDGVVDYYTLQHFPFGFQRRRFLQLHACLQPGGHFLFGSFTKKIFLDADTMATENTDGALVKRRKSGGERHFYLWDPADLKQLLERAGFELVFDFVDTRGHRQEYVCRV